MQVTEQNKNNLDRRAQLFYKENMSTIRECTEKEKRHSRNKHQRHSRNHPAYIRNSCHYPQKQQSIQNTKIIKLNTPPCQIRIDKKSMNYDETSVDYQPQQTGMRIFNSIFNAMLSSRTKR